MVIAFDMCEREWGGQERNNTQNVRVLVLLLQRGEEEIPKEGGRKPRIDRMKASAIARRAPTPNPSSSASHHPEKIHMGEEDTRCSTGPRRSSLLEPQFSQRDCHKVGDVDVLIASERFGVPRRDKLGDEIWSG